MAKKIVIVLPALKVGGTERAAVVLSDYLVQEGFEVTILTMFKRERFYSLNKDIRILEPSSSRVVPAWLNVSFLILFLRRSLKSEHPQTILCMGYILYALIAAVGLKGKLVISPRSSPLRKRFNQNMILNYFYDLLYLIFKYRIDLVIAQTEYAQSIFKKKYPCPVYVVPNLLRQINKHDVFRGNSIVILGRVVNEKGHHYLIDAFSRLDAPAWNLLIVGDGPQLEFLKKYAIGKGVYDRVCFLGYQRDVDKYLSSSKIFAMTSLIEGYPNALIEAMANGLAPVCFNCVAGPSEIICHGKNGFLVEVGDVSDLARKLQLLIDNPDLLNMFANAAIETTKNNRIESIGPLYKSVLFGNSVQ